MSIHQKIPLIDHEPRSHGATKRKCLLRVSVPPWPVAAIRAWPGRRDQVTLPPMRTRTLVLAAACLLFTLSITAQEGHPLTGTWAGDWGSSGGARTHITMVMNWDGKAITGLLNPGPDQAPLTSTKVGSRPSLASSRSRTRSTARWKATALIRLRAATTWRGYTSWMNPRRVSA